jgi:hypothetical protein
LRGGGWGFAASDAERRLAEASARFIEEFGEDHVEYPRHLVARAELAADRGEWGLAVARAAAARARLAPEVATDRAADLDWHTRQVRRADLARANRVLERGRVAGHAARID